MNEAELGANGLRCDSPAAAVFDCDGLLIDSAGCWREAYERVLAKEGRTLNDELFESLNGASVGSAAKTLGVAADALYTKLRQSLERSPLSERPGARVLLSELQGRVAMAVATNAPRELASLALSRVGLEDHLPVILSAEGGPGKPAPDVYLAACERLGVLPKHAVAFEDSPIGAAAAQAAGLRLIYIPSAECGAVEADLQASRLDDDAVLALFQSTAAGMTGGAP